MKLLVSAFSCGPGLGSEPGVGWHTIEELAREHEVWALVDINCKAKIQEALQGPPPERIHLRFVRVPVLAGLMSGRFGNGLTWLVYYYLWQIVQWLEARKLHASVGFDACQHITFVKYNVPSFLHLLGIPFIWGPVGGAESAPSEFYREFGWKTRFAEAARVALQQAAKLDPWLRWCHRRSARALAVTEQTAVAMRDLGAPDVAVLPAVALSREELKMLSLKSPKHEAQPLTLLYVGRLIPWKGVHLGIRALAALPNQQVRYRIIGDGPLKPFLEAEARRLGVGDQVSFLGNLPREDVLKAYAEADGFLYPSLHDSGGNAVLEAMGAGLPIICLRYGGPDLLVTDACGWKVPAETTGGAVTQLAAAIKEFAENPGLREQRGRAAQAHCVENHSWAARGTTLRAVYHQLMMK